MIDGRTKAAELGRFRRPKTESSKCGGGRLTPPHVFQPLALIGHSYLARSSQAYIESRVQCVDTVSSYGLVWKDDILLLHTDASLTTS